MALPRVVVPAPGPGGTAVPPPRQDPPTPRPPRTRPDQGRPAATPPASWWTRNKRKIRITTLATLLVIALIGAGTLAWGTSQFKRIERVALDDVLASDDGTNYLIVGSDTREGIGESDPNASAILGPEAPVGSERSDTILILRVDAEGTRMLSVPRDLLVTIAETGQRTRINAAFNGGPRRLIATLRDELGLPIHHYLEVDFASFQQLVDALGGIVIDFPHPARDHKSGLSVPTAGAVTLDGSQALAYVRSRYYVELIDGREVGEGTGDIGRVVRQQAFLAAVMHEVGAVRNPIRLASITSSMVGGMRIDSSMTFRGAIGLLMEFRSADPLPFSLPTSNLTLSSGAQVLQLVQPDANAILSQFGSAGAR